MSSRRKILLIVLPIAIVLLSGGGFLTYKVLHGSSPIPAPIDKQLDFITLYPAQRQSTTVDPTSFKYDPKAQVLSFIMTIDGVTSTITEQATPDTFNDIPQYYSRLIEEMNGYSTISTYNGNVDLTRPSDVSGQQVAVMNAKGVLMFAHSMKDLTSDQWRRFFNGLQGVK